MSQHALIGEAWQRQVPLAPYTTLQVGGPADFFARCESVGELAARAGEALAANVPLMVLGGGSNVLVADAGVAGAVVHNAVTGIRYEVAADTCVLAHVGAGEPLDAFIADTVARGYWGLENLSDIPGTVGATPVQNVGAYGVEVSDRIREVEVYDSAAGTTRTLRRDECAFGYRHSVFKTAAGAALLVVRVTFALSPAPAPVLHYAGLSEQLGTTTPSQQAVRDAVRAIRSRKFPDWRRVGTAGSFFKNPVLDSEHFESLRAQFPALPGFPHTAGTVKVPLGWVLEHVCGLRGVRRGTVGTYAEQALVLVNYGGATAAEIDAFAHEIAAQVYAATGITVTREVQRVGKWGDAHTYSHEV